MRNIIKTFCAVIAVSVLPAAPAMAAGDLLVAPTRVVLDGQRGTEVILNNVGAEEATYRISLELRRMTPDGKLAEVTPEEANELEAAALAMIRFAPRRVTLVPNQPQAIRIGIRAPKELADGEYRAHMLFRAIPKARAAVKQEGAPQGVSIALTPIYGVTIPVIVRKGQLKATAALSNGRIEATDYGQALAFDVAREGTGSTYGEIVVTKPGVSDPLLVARGIAVYSEINKRTVMLPISAEAAAALSGPVKIEYFEAARAGGGLIASMQTTLR